MSDSGQPLLYALVAYVNNALGQFAERLRAEVHPAHAHLPSHLSVLPPRPLNGGSESDALDRLRRSCAAVAPFEVEMGDVGTFLPTTPTVFLRVSYAAYRLRELHDLLNQGALEYTEPLIYMPHMTIAKLATNERAQEVFEISKNRWSDYQGTRRTAVSRLVFVKGFGACWEDLADVELCGSKT